MKLKCIIMPNKNRGWVLGVGGLWLGKNQDQRFKFQIPRP
jgi:hypothetical protein